MYSIILTTLSPESHRTSEENLGLEYLKSSLEKEGYNVEIIDAWLNNMSIDEVYNKIISKENELLFVGISSYMGNTKATIELISKLKKYDSSIKVACGGFGPTFYPYDYLNNGADFVMRGEGEKAICELANCIKNNLTISNVKNVGYKNYLGDVILNDMECLNDDLDSLPFPSRDYLDIVLKKKSSVNMVTSRGCSGNCEFCSVISFFRLSDGRVWRGRSINNIVDEIEMLYKSGVKYIKMVDDSFIDGYRDEKWCEKFADEIIRRNIKVKLRGQIRADKVTDSILYNLKRAGFFSFACGIENGSETALKRMNKKANLDDNKNALSLFKKYGYLVQMGFILFDKDTTYEELIDNYRFMKAFDFTVTKGIFSEMFSAEGTKLNSKLKKENELIVRSFKDNNNKYVINNEMVKRIYNALKLWHKSHSRIYDMTIDPLTAPKAIDEVYMNDFYKYTMLLKKEDLKMFKTILLNAKNERSLKKIVSDNIIDTKPYYNSINEAVKKLYKNSGLNYLACENPFI